MTLNRSRFLVRWFFWSLAIQDAFTDGSRVYRCEERGANLCHFVQTLLLWTPILLLLHLVWVGLVLGAFIIAPIYWFGLGSYSAVIVGLLAIIGLIVGAVAFFQWRSERPDSDEPSAVKIVTEWVGARKQRICPLISFTSVGGFR